MTERQFLNKLNKRLKECEPFLKERTIPSYDQIVLRSELTLLRSYLKNDDDNERKKIRKDLENIWNVSELKFPKF